MRLLLFFILSLLLSNAMAQKTNKRQVLILGQETSQQIKAQQALLEKDSIGLKDRDMTVSIVVGQSPLYRRFRVDASEHFVIMLIGKDGIEKFRSKELTSAQQLFALVDTMPMRKEEMRLGKKSH